MNDARDSKREMTPARRRIVSEAEMQYTPRAEAQARRKREQQERQSKPGDTPAKTEPPTP